MRLSLQLFLQLFPHLRVMQTLNGLLQPNGDQQADDDGCDVDEEVFPGVGGFVWRVYI